jgi:hypothetical protein
VVLAQGGRCRRRHRSRQRPPQQVSGQPRPISPRPPWAHPSQALLQLPPWQSWLLLLRGRVTSRSTPTTKSRAAPGALGGTGGCTAGRVAAAGVPASVTLLPPQFRLQAVVHERGDPWVAGTMRRAPPLATARLPWPWQPLQRRPLTAREPPLLPRRRPAPCLLQRCKAAAAVRLRRAAVIAARTPCSPRTSPSCGSTRRCERRRRLLLYLCLRRQHSTCVCGGSTRTMTADGASRSLALPAGLVDVMRQRTPMGASGVASAFLTCDTCAAGPLQVCASTPAGEQPVPSHSRSNESAPTSRLWLQPCDYRRYCSVAGSHSSCRTAGYTRRRLR